MYVHVKLQMYSSYKYTKAYTSENRSYLTRRENATAIQPHSSVVQLKIPQINSTIKDSPQKLCGAGRVSTTR